MLNLLRPEQKKKIIREYHVRFFVLALTLLFVSQIIAIILLVPSYLTSKSAADNLNSQNAALQAQSADQEGSTLNATIQKTNDSINIFSSIASSSPDVIAALHKVIDNKGGAVRIIGLNYSIQGKQQQVTMQGVAASRQDLLNFAKQLKQQKGIVSADLPISDFSQAQNINFSLPITITSSNL